MESKYSDFYYLMLCCCFYFCLLSTVLFKLYQFIFLFLIFNGKAMWSKKLFIINEILQKKEVVNQESESTDEITINKIIRTSLIQ